MGCCLLIGLSALDPTFPPGTGAHSDNPDYIEAYLYIGDMLTSKLTSAGEERSKSVHFLNTDEAAGTSITVSPTDFSSANYKPDKIDVFINGQLLHSGSAAQVTAGERDYYVAGASSLKFSFQTRIDDILDVVVFSIAP